MRLREQLLAVSEAFAKAVDRSEARVSTMAFGSGDSIARLRDGADMRSERLHNGLQWFSENWPDDKASWPTDVPRPPKALATAEETATETGAAA